eukprot:693875-Pelagomonas_calceolata.AAC.3
MLERAQLAACVAPWAQKQIQTFSLGYSLFLPAPSMLNRCPYPPGCLAKRLRACRLQYNTPIRFVDTTYMTKASNQAACLQRDQEGRITWINGGVQMCKRHSQAAHL